jgi:superfamily II DNA/RNA helicase
MTSSPTPNSTAPATTSAGAPFSDLALSPAMLATLAQLGYDTMTPIQAASLPLALAGQDLIAQAKTGSGKTAAFGLAVLHRHAASTCRRSCSVPRASWPIRSRRKSAAWRVRKRTSRC